MFHRILLGHIGVSVVFLGDQQEPEVLQQPVM